MLVWFETFLGHKRTWLFTERAIVNILKNISCYCYWLYQIFHVIFVPSKLQRYVAEWPNCLRQHVQFESEKSCGAAVQVTPLSGTRLSTRKTLSWPSYNSYFLVHCENLFSIFSCSRDLLRLQSSSESIFPFPLFTTLLVFF